MNLEYFDSFKRWSRILVFYLFLSNLDGGFLDVLTNYF